MSTVLVVEDEEDLLAGLSLNLADEGYDVLTAGTGEEALQTLRDEKPHLVILDVQLPGLSGFDVCRKLRLMGHDMPVLMLTAKSDEISRVVGLEIGADDYVAKPFSLPELLARVRAHLRRYTAVAGAGETKFAFGDIEVDFDRYTARRKKKTIHLTPTEFELLRLLVTNRGAVVTRDRILNEVWGYEASPTTRTVDNHVFMLRKKLGDSSRDPRFIVAVYGEGYRFIG